MGREIVYCWKCATQLRGEDFDAELAYRVGDKVSCPDCIDELIADLSAEEQEAIRWLDDRLPKHALSLTTVHAFSACPIGERADKCAADSYGKVARWENLYVNDASILPDSPGVNPQGSVMAFARRNALHFLANLH